jgi:hypothetical protein
MSQARLTPQFVEFLPDDIGHGILYVSMSYAVAAHRCACGCGREVVTPLSPTDWKLTFDGVSVSLEPSIGNWTFPCRSHYFIRGSKVQWAANMSEAAIQRGRERDRESKAAHFARSTTSGALPAEVKPVSSCDKPSQPEARPTSAFGWLRRLFR